MHSLTIRDYLKCAHSLRGEIFGPAQLLHVITYEVDVAFSTEKLDRYGIIVDFASAQRALHEILSRLNFKNLDTLPELRGRNTTTEFLCRHIHEKVASAVRGKFKGLLRVTLRESPVAWSSFESPVRARRPGRTRTSPRP
jgi:6-pyruvoyl-tetrahydropterin synthase